MRSKDYISPTALVLNISPDSFILQVSSASTAGDYGVSRFDWSEEGYIN